MTAKKGCEFSEVCRRADLYMQPKQPRLSYWPRDRRLKPYCSGQEDPGNCIVRSYWNENPTIRKPLTELAEGLGEDSEFMFGALLAGLGQYLLWAGDSYITTAAGAASSLSGIYVLLNGLSKRFKKKGIIKLLREIGESDGVDDVYNKIMAKAEEETEGDEENFWDARTEEVIAKGNPWIKELGLSADDVKSILVSPTRFNIGKIIAHYPLTNDFSLSADKDIGVALSFAYYHKPFGETGCESSSEEGIKTYYTTGILFPRISGKRLAKGTGFINSTAYVPPLPVPSFTKSVNGTGVRLDVLVAGVSGIEIGPIDSIFGSIIDFDRFVDIKEEEARMNAKNLHRFMQDILYSDF